VTGRFFPYWIHGGRPINIGGLDVAHQHQRRRDVSAVRVELHAEFNAYNLRSHESLTPRTSRTISDMSPVVVHMFHLSLSWLGKRLEKAIKHHESQIWLPFSSHGKNHKSGPWTDEYINPCPAVEQGMGPTPCSNSAIGHYCVWLHGDAKG